MKKNLFSKYLSYVDFVLSRSIQCEYNDEELFEHNGEDTQANWHWEMAKSLEALKFLLLDEEKFMDFLDENGQSSELDSESNFKQLCLEDYFDDIF